MHLLPHQDNYLHGLKSESHAHAWILKALYLETRTQMLTLRRQRMNIDIKARNHVDSVINTADYKMVELFKLLLLEELLSVLGLN